MPDASQVPVPLNNTRSSTIPDAVARYRKVPYYNLLDQIVTHKIALANDTSLPCMIDASVMPASQYGDTSKDGVEPDQPCAEPCEPQCGASDHAPATAPCHTQTRPTNHKHVQTPPARLPARTPSSPPSQQQPRPTHVKPTNPPSRQPSPISSKQNQH